MAKKTIKVGLRSTGAEPASGDVNISYKGSRIAGLSESSTAVLETENTIVEDDIEVEYTKPAGTGYVPLTVTDDAESAHTFNYVTSSLGYVIDGNMTKPVAMTTTIIPNALLPNYRPTEAKPYKISIFIGCASDLLTVKVGNDTLTYADGAYGFEQDYTEYPGDMMTLTISDAAS